MNNLLDNFGTNCFSEKNLKNRVPDYVVKKFLEIKNGKAELTLEIADIIANVGIGERSNTLYTLVSTSYRPYS